MGEWKVGICGCFADCGTCILGSCVPCYLVGKDAEAVGDSCLLCGLAYIFLPPCIGAMVRKKIRENRSIDGSIVGDFCCHCWLPCCTVIQEHNEVLAMETSSMAIERE